MPTVARTYNIGEIVWVVDPANKTLLPGVIDSFVAKIHYSPSMTEVQTIRYFVILDVLGETIATSEPYISLTQQDGLIMLAALIDTEGC